MTGDPAAGEREARLRALLPLFKRAESELESVLTGLSMTPAIPSGASIRIRCAGLDACGVGDIVAMQDNGTLRVHRVVYRGRGRAAARYLVTRGDALWLPDPPVRIADLLGLVTAVQRDGAWRPPLGAGRPSRRAVLSLRVIASALEANVVLARTLSRAALTTRRMVLRARRALGRLARPHGRAPGL